MPASPEKETKKGSFLKDVRNAAIASVLLLAYIRGHNIRMQEELQKSNPDVIPSSTSNTCPTPTPLTLGEPVVIYPRGY